MNGLPLEGLLSACLSNDNQVRKEAETAVKALSAVKDQVKNILLERIVSEREHAVTRAVADVVGVIAKHTVPRNEWPELLGFLQQCSTSPKHEHREVALTLFSSLTETIGECLQPHVMGLQAVVLAGLKDTHESVVVAALSAMERLSQLVLNEAEIQTFHGLVAAMLAVGTKAVTTGSEDIAVQVCQLLVDLVECPAPLLQPQLPAALQFAMTTASNVELDLETRGQALQVVQWVARYKPKQLAKHKVLLKQLIGVLCSLACEPPEPNFDDSQGIPAKELAAQTLDALALHVGSAHVLPQLLVFSKGACASPDVCTRAASIAVLAIVAEGCSEPLRKKVEDVLPMVLRGLQDPEQSVRCAAAFAIGQFSQYLQPDIVGHYEAVLPCLFAAMADPMPDVQERGCYALDAFCENLDQEILPYLPQLLARLGDVRHLRQGITHVASCSTLCPHRSFSAGWFTLPVSKFESKSELSVKFESKSELSVTFESKSELPVKFVSKSVLPVKFESKSVLSAECESKSELSLMARLGDVLQHGGRSMQEMALSAIASTVAAAGTDFEPYVAPLLPILQHFMVSSSSDLLKCRCRATEVAGLVLEFLGAQPSLRSAVPHLMQLGLKGFVLGENELNEFSHGMFSCAARALGPEFAPYLQYVVPLALASCKLDDGTWNDSSSEDEDKEDASHRTFAANGGGSSSSGRGSDPAHGRVGGASLAADDDSDEEDGGDGGRFSVRTGVLDEKCAATMALGMYAEACPAQYSPYTAATLEVLVAMSLYFHEDVRMQSSEALARLTVSVYTSSQPPLPQNSPPAPTPPAHTTFSPETLTVLQSTHVALLAAIEDEDKSAVASGFLGLGMVIKALGLGCLDAGKLEVVVKQSEQLLKGEAGCQQTEEDDDEEGEEEDEDAAQEDEELLASVAELLPILADAAGPDPSQPEAIRATAVGVTAELAERLKLHMVPHLDKVVPFLLRELRADGDTNRQNAAFCCGVLAAHCGTQMGPLLTAILQALHPLFAETEDGGVRDNACGAVSRMLSSCAAALPLERVVSVLLESLPLREDFDEAKAVYGALVGLLTGDQAMRVAPLLPSIVTALTESSTQDKIPPDVRRSVALSLAALATQYPEHVVPLLAACPPEQRAALEQLAATPAPAL
ncbi:MAG: hypothetical protein WDW38_000740 [Sanguina aurantia]